VTAATDREMSQLSRFGEAEPAFAS
jgi:hypothetical protein